MIRQRKRGEVPAIVPTTGWTAPLTTLTAAVMAFLAVLTLAAGLASDRLAREWRTDLAGVATVRLAAPADVREARIRAVVEVLRTTPGIAEVRVLDEAEQTALLTPWLGQDINLADLPAPQLIDVALEGGGPDREALQGRLDATVPGAVYDDHATWRAPLADAARALGRLAWVATALTVAAAAAMIALAARMTLSANREVVAIVRLIGGEDSFIARAFVTRLTLRAWAGATVGALAGALAIAMMPSVDGSSGLNVSLTPSPAGWIVLVVAVPLASGLIAWAAARITVHLTLARMG